MGQFTLVERFKLWVSSIGWRLFIWGSGMTEEDYWKEIKSGYKYDAPTGGKEQGDA